jgi:hypothetical protein
VGRNPRGGRWRIILNSKMNAQNQSGFLDDNFWSRAGDWAKANVLKPALDHNLSNLQQQLPGYHPQLPGITMPPLVSTQPPMWNVTGPGATVTAPRPAASTITPLRIAIGAVVVGAAGYGIYSLTKRRRR